MIEGGDGADTNLEDCCVGKLCTQNGHGLCIRLPFAYTNSKGVEGRIYSGDDDGHGDSGGSINLVAGEPPVLAIEGIHNLTILAPYGGAKIALMP